MKKYLLSKTLKWQDAILTAIAIALIFLFARMAMPFSEAVSGQTDLSLGYIAKAFDDRYYTLDEAHTRLLCFDHDGHILFQIKNPSDNGESILYIDDFILDEGNLYLSASEWNGMLLDREVILHYDSSGTFLRKITELDYRDEAERTNKHRIYGLSVDGQALTWAECRADEILVHRLALDSASGDDALTHFAYPNAFNAVSDLAFAGSDPVIMDKNGTIVRLGNNQAEKLLYSTKWNGEQERVPFRMTWQAGTVIFTDIRAGEVCRADTEAKRSDVLYSQTDSQTVTCGPEEGLLLMESLGLTVTGDPGVRYCTLQKSSGQLFTQALFLLCTILLAVVLLFFIFRMGIVAFGFIRGGKKTFPVLVLLSALCISILISAMLMEAFKDSYRGKIEEQLESAAYSVAASVLEEDLAQIHVTSDFGSEAYQHLRMAMEHAFPPEVSFFRSTYCNLLKMDREDQPGYAVAYLDQSIGVYFPLDEVEAEEVRSVYKSRSAVLNQTIEDVSGIYFSVKVPITGTEESVIGVVAVGVDASVVQDMIRGMQRDVLMSIAAMLLLLWVISNEIVAYTASRNAYANLVEENARKVSIQSVSVLRILVFVVFCAFNMVSSFLPVYILQMCGRFPDAWRGVAASLPMALNIFVMGIMSLVCVRLVNGLGVRRLLLLSALLSAGGYLLLWLGPGYAAVVAGLLLDGLGVGLITNTIFVMIAGLSDERERQQSLSIYNTASLSGMNFGMLAGGLLASHVGQKNVFELVAVLWGLLFLSAWFLMKKAGDAHARQNTDEKSAGTLSTGKFLLSKPVWSFILLVQNPYIVFSSFVFYFVPIFCDRMGYNEIAASFFLLLYSETAVLLGATLTERVDRTFGNRGIYLGIALNVLALLSFYSTGSVGVLFITLIILGVSEAFSKPVQQEYFLRQKVVAQYGGDRAMGIYNFMENIGESMGPVIFGAITAAGGIGAPVFLGIVAVCDGIHFALNRKERDNA